MAEKLLTVLMFFIFMKPAGGQTPPPEPPQETLSIPVPTNTKSKKISVENTNIKNLLSYETDDPELQAIMNNIEYDCNNNELTLDGLKNYKDSLKLTKTTGNAHKIKREVNSILENFVLSELKRLTPKVRALRSRRGNAKLIQEYEEALAAFELYIIDPLVKEIWEIQDDFRRGVTDRAEAEDDFSTKQDKLRAYLNNRFYVDKQLENTMKMKLGAPDIAKRLRFLSIKIMKNSNLDFRSSPTRRHRETRTVLRDESKKWDIEHGLHRESPRFARKAEFLNGKLRRLDQEWQTIQQTGFQACQRNRIASCRRFQQDYFIMQQRYLGNRSRLAQEIAEVDRYGRSYYSMEQKGRQYQNYLRNGNQQIQSPRMGAYDSDKYILGYQGNQNTSLNVGYPQPNGYGSAFQNFQQKQNPQAGLGGIYPGFGTSQYGAQNYNRNMLGAGPYNSTGVQTFPGQQSFGQQQNFGQQNFNRFASPGNFPGYSRNSLAATQYYRGMPQQNYNPYNQQQGFYPGNLGRGLARSNPYGNGSFYQSPGFGSNGFGLNNSFRQGMPSFQYGGGGYFNTQRNPFQFRGYQGSTLSNGYSF